MVGVAALQIKRADSAGPSDFGPDLSFRRKRTTHVRARVSRCSWAVTTSRPYLQGSRFIVHTDHASLRLLLEIAERSGRLMRWGLRLSKFDFEVRYQKGKANSQADALSRLATLGETVLPVDEEIPCFTTDADVVLYGPDIPMADDQLAKAFALQDYNPSGRFYGQSPRRHSCANR